MTVESAVFNVEGEDEEIVISSWSASRNGSFIILYTYVQNPHGYNLGTALKHFR